MTAGADTMNKATKGALAAFAGGTLLVGGAGTLAYWTDTETIDGSDIDSGHLALAEGATCDTAWQLNGTVDYAAQILSPGDELSRHCEYVVSVSGTNLSADLVVSAPAFEAGGDLALENDLDLDPAYSYDADGAGVGAAVPVVNGTVAGIADGSVIDVTITVAYQNVGVENNDSNIGTDLSAALADITVTATQAS